MKKARHPIGGRAFFRSAASRGYGLWLWAAASRSYGLWLWAAVSSGPRGRAPALSKPRRIE